MKRIILLVTVVAVMAAMTAFSGIAGATHSEGDGPNQDLVAGTGHFHQGGGNSHFHVNAKSGPAGEDPQGRFFGRRSEGPLPVHYRARVTCLRVDGNNASIGGVVEESKTPLVPVGSGWIIFIEDNGEPGSNADKIQGNLVSVPPPSNGCPPPAVSFVFPPIEQGNFIVHDQTP